MVTMPKSKSVATRRYEPFTIRHWLKAAEPDLSSMFARLRNSEAK
jgi:hypothetical protein